MRNRRRHRQANVKQASFIQQPWTQPQRRFQPMDLVSEDEIESLHQATLKILRDTGVHFMSAKARDFLKTQPGTYVDDETEIVRFDPDLVEERVKTIPREFTIYARNPSHNLKVGGNHISFSHLITPPYVMDQDHGKRNGTNEEFQNLLRLTQSLNAVNFIYGYPVEPQDLHAETRHLDAYRSYIQLTDKIWRGYTLGDNRIMDAIEMARIGRGISNEQMVKEPSFIANVTTNSPLRIDEPMGEGLMLMAEANQPISITSFAMAGAIAPITVAGATAMQNAEILAAVVLSQSVRAGAPIVYGTFTANVYMRTGAIAFGGPDLAKATLLSGQLARRYGFPLKSAVTNGAKTLDAQAGYETQGALWAAINSGASIVAHACGWMESGLTVSREKMIIDAEMIQMMNNTLEPMDMSEDAMAVDTIHEVGPGGQYFDCDHTIARFKTENYEPMVSDWESRENWEERGALSAEDRANVIWKELMEDYEQPPLDQAIVEELDAYVERRRPEIEATL